MKAAIAVALACLTPSAVFAASLTGSSVSSAATVDFARVGTLAWARWPGYRRLGSEISDVATTGVVKHYADDRRLIGDRQGIKVAGGKASFEFTVAATTVERTLTYYVGGWNATGRVTVTLPGAKPYTTTFSSTTHFSRVVTVKYRADAPTQLLVNYTLTAGGGSINMQAAALSQSASAPSATPSGEAGLTWQAPVSNMDGTVLTDLSGFNLYWGSTPGTYSHSTRIPNAASRSHTVTGLAPGTWHFVVTAVNGEGTESSYSNVWSKTVQ
jgi:hypothetical protein